MQQTTEKGSDTNPPKNEGTLTTEIKALDEGIVSKDQTIIIDANIQVQPIATPEFTSQADRESPTHDGIQPTTSVISTISTENTEPPGGNEEVHAEKYSSYLKCKIFQSQNVWIANT